jgi:uncharacterized protein
MAVPNFGTFNRAGTVADQAAFDVGLRAHMVRVYNYMASGLALSGIVAFALFNFSELAVLLFQVQGNRVVGLNVLGWVAIFAPLGLLLLVSFRARSMSLGAVQAVYWAVTALMGVSLSLLLFYAPNLDAMAGEINYRPISFVCFTSKITKRRLKLLLP